MARGSVWKAVPNRMVAWRPIYLDSTDRVSMGHILSEPVTEISSSLHKGDHFTVGAASCQGWRSTMEDKHTVLPSTPDRPDVAFFAVFDGHGGIKTADACGKKLHKYILSQQEFNSNVSEAIRKGCLELDAAIKSESTLRPYEWDDSGSTATFLLITKNQIYVGNVGDSRTVGVVGGQVVPLSEDHKPFRADESRRIYSAGGWVEAGRVNGVLSLSRAFGDYTLKGNGRLPAQMQAVTAVPDVVERRLTESWEMVVLACDGIWDVLSNEEVCSLSRRLLRQGKSAEEVCREVVVACRSPGSCWPRGVGCDNMTIILIVFDWAKHDQEEPPNQTSTTADPPTVKTIKNNKL